MTSTPPFPRIPALAFVLALGCPGIAGETIRVTYRFPEPEVLRGKAWDRVRVEGLDEHGTEGAPLLPRRVARILLPPGSELDGVSFVAGEAAVLPGPYRIQPAARSASPTDGIAPEPPEPDPTIYAASDAFPASPVQTICVGRKCGRAVAIFSLAPVRYRPAIGSIEHVSVLTLEVRTRPAGGGSDPSIETTPRHAIEELRGAVDNPEILPEAPDGAGAADDDVVVHAIVTTAPLAASFEPLAAARTAAGLPSRVYTMDWIRATYDGRRPDGKSDDATRVRNFAIDLFANRGLQYLLLAGDADGGGDCPACVPTRYFQTANLFAGAIPADMYFGCLDGTFDEDADGIYGEPNDGPDGADVDLLFEVHVGRAPVDDPGEAASFVAKTLAYETSSGLVLREVLLVGEHLGFGGEYEWGGNLNDAIRTGSDRYIETVGFESSDVGEDLRIRTLYDRDSLEGGWKPAELVTLLEQGIHVVNHVGHADSSTVMKLTAEDVRALRGGSAFLGYSQSCYAGAFDNVTTDGSLGEDAIVEELLAAPSGAAAFIANTRRGWAGSMDADGPSQRLDRRFWHAVLGLGVRRWGAANDRSKEESVHDIASSERSRWCAYELTTFGDPALAVKFTSRRGSLAADRDWYVVARDMVVTVTDSDMDAAPDRRDAISVTAVSSATGDRRTVPLEETGLSTGTFQGTVVPLEGPPPPDAPSAAIQVRAPDSVTFEYEDADDGTGSAATASRTVRVVRPLELTGDCPPAGYLGVPYRFPLEAGGGLPPYRFLSGDGKGYVEVLGAPRFEGVGVRQNWQSDEGAWIYALPFSFPFYGETYDQVTVSSNGYLQLGEGSGMDFDNSVYRLIHQRRIAVFWADLVTGGGGDIYIDDSKLDSVTIRWRATGYHTQGIVECEVELFEDGAIRLGYGSGNVGASPTIGISAGDGLNYLVASVSGRDDLSSAPSVHFYPTRLPRGLSVDEATGAIVGFPEEAGPHEVLLMVEDSLGQTASRVCSVQVHPTGIVLADPAAGGLYLAGSETTIRWEWFGSIGANVRLDYNTDGSTTSFPFPISASVPLGNRTFSWKLPAAPAATARVRVRSVESPQFSTYGGAFSIVGPTIVLRSPVGGERWVVGSTATVRWDRIGNTGSRVRVVGCTDGSTSTFPWILAADAPNSGTLTVTVPATVSETCRVRVESISPAGIHATSPGLFAIRRPSLTVVSPNGGECLEAGEPVTVSWTADGTTEALVQVEFNIDGRTDSFPYAISEAPLPNTGSAVWTVPEVNVEAARLRVRSYPRSSYSDLSDAPFRIRSRCTTRVLVWIPYIDAEEEQAVGVEQALRRAAGDIEIAFSTALSPAGLRTELAQTDAFVVPRQKGGGGIDFGPLGEAIAPVLRDFLATGGSVTFCHQIPESEEILRTVGLLDFRTVGEGTTLCEVLRPEHPIAAGIRPNFAGPFRTGWYEVRDPVATRVIGDARTGGAVLATRPHGFGRLTLLGFDFFSFNDATGRLLSNAVHLEVPPAGIRLLGPDPGRAFLVGDPIPIRWIARGSARGRARLTASYTGSETDFPVAIGEFRPDGDFGSFDWTIPELPAGFSWLDVRIRIEAVDAPSHRDVLAGTFQVVAPLALATTEIPEASVRLPYRAEVRCRGGLPPYEITIVGLPEGLVQRPLDESAVEIVGVPQRECPECDIEVSVRDAAGAQAAGHFPLPVLVRGLELERPAGGEMFLYGTEQTVRWRAYGAVGATARITYNTDASLLEFPFVVAESVPIGDGATTWLLPVVDAPTCRLRIQSSESPEFQAVSGPFSIVGPSVRIEAPDGDECWEPGREKRIRWSSATSGAETIRIDYSIDGSESEFPFTIAEAAPDTGEHRWVVDAPPTDACRVRLSFTSNPGVRDVSERPFRVRPGCSLRGVAWSPFLSLAEARDRLVDGIAAHEEDLEVEASDASTSAMLASQIVNRDFVAILLVDAPSGARALSTGAAVKDVLLEFVETGGVVVLCGPNANGLELARGLGILEAGEVSSTRGEPCSLVSPLHPVARGVPEEFTLGAATLSWALQDAAWETVVSQDGRAAVAAREQGRGRWVLLGHDFGASDPVAARLAANSVRFRPIEDGLRILEPAEGAILFSGEPVSIRWAARGSRSGTVRASYNTDGSATDFPFEAGTAASGPTGGSLAWTVPATDSADEMPCRLRVGWSTPPELPAVTDGVVHLVAEPLRIVTEFLPSGYQNAPYAWQVEAAGGARPYAFDASGLHAGLYLVAPEPGSRRADIAGTPIETGTDRDVRVRVRDALGLAAERNFRLDVVPSQIEILSPAGDEHLLAGSVCEVRWRVRGYAGESFRVEYNLDGSSRTFGFLAAESTPSGGTFRWTLPDVEAPTVRLRVASNDIAGLAAVAPRTFAISAPGVTCVHPNGSEQLEARTTRTIRWRSLGNPGATVRIDLSLEGSLTDFPLAVAEAPDTGEYEWEVPGDVSQTCRLRVRWTDAPHLEDASDSVFSICYRANPRALVWIPHAGFDDLEVRGAIAAATIHEHDLRWVLSKALEEEQLESELWGKEAFLMVEQQAPEANYKALARELGPALDRFVRKGGTAVFLKQIGNGREFLPATGLLEVSESGREAAATCRVAWPEHPVVSQVPDAFRSPSATAWYEAGADAEVYATTAEGGATVLGRPLGDGRIVVIGFDYRDYNEETARVLANSLRNTRVGELPVFVRGDANSSGVVDLGDAICILNFLFRGVSRIGCMDAADVDDSAELGGSAPPISISDAVLLIRWLFLGGAPPAPPSPGNTIHAVPQACGTDPTPRDGLDCAFHAPCVDSR